MFKKISIIMLCAMLLLANTTTIKAANYKYATTTVNIRKRPSKESKSLGMLYDMEKVISLGKIGKWEMVEYKNKIAYIKSQYLSKKKPRYVIKSSPSGFFKSYMDYRCITSTSSPQYKLQHTEAYTDPATGIRMVDRRYCVALGSGFCSKIGTKVDMIMKSGKTIRCILSDQKKDSETIAGHKMHGWDKSVAEFLIETSCLNRKARRDGDISAIPLFKGAIKSIKVYKK